MGVDHLSRSDEINNVISFSDRCHRTHKGTGRLRTGKRDQKDLGVASTVPTAAFTIG